MWETSVKQTLLSNNAFFVVVVFYVLFLSYPLLLCCWEWLSSASVQNKMVVFAVPESDPFAVSFWQFPGGTGLAASSTAVFLWHREH